MNVATLVRSIRRRKEHRGILTRDTWLRDLSVCLDGRCPSGLLEGVTRRQWNGWLKATGEQLAYDSPDMVVDEGGVWSLAGKAKAAKELPPHTIATFPAVITTTRQDHDGDVLETEGAELDPSSPLLWQHLPDMPIGRLFAPGQHTKSKLTGQFTIADTALGQDAALLSAHGALRISHGFLPTKWEPLESDDAFAGYHILKFKILEVSLVSVPSNPDAVIEAFSREKLNHPLVKAWAGAKFKERPTVVQAGIDLRSLPPGTIILGSGQQKPDEKSCTCHLKHAKGAVPYKATPAAPEEEAWDADAAVKSLREWAGVDGEEPTEADWKKYERGFAYVEGDGGELGAYKLPHHKVEGGKLVVVFKGVAAAIGALNGARGGGMKLSDDDRKAAYEHLAKHYQAIMGDDAEVPELKSLAVATKGLYLDLEGSWDRTRDQLAETVKAYLISSGCAGPADWVYIAAMFPDHALVAVLEDAMATDQCVAWDDANATYYEVEWKLIDGAAAWEGEVTEVEVSVDVSESTERNFTVQSKAFVKPEHVKKLAKAMDHLETVMGHEDTTPQVNTLAKRAHGHVKAVHDAHAGDKGVLTDKHAERLEKAMNYCSQGSEHEDSTAPLRKAFRGAMKHVKDVMDDAGGADEASANVPGTKSGAKFSAENGKHLKSAFHHLKAVENHTEATKAIADLASKAAGKIGGLFSTGGDNGSDYDADGNFTGDDFNSYTAAAESGKAGAAVSKESAEAIGEAYGQAKELSKHAEATKAVKALAKGAMAHLKAVLPDPDANDAQDDDDGDMSLHGGNPTNSEPAKSLGDSLSALADEVRFAIAEGDEEKLLDLIEAAGAVDCLADAVRELRSVKP